MSKVKKSKKNTGRKLRQTPLTEIDNYEMLSKMAIGALISGVIGGLFTGVAVFIWPDTNPTMYFQVGGVIAGIMGTFIGSNIYKKQNDPKKREMAFIVLGAILMASAADLAILLFLILLR